MPKPYMGAIVRSFRVIGTVIGVPTIAVVSVDYDENIHPWLFEINGAKNFADQLTSVLLRHGYSDIRNHLDELDDIQFKQVAEHNKDFEQNRPAVDATVMRHGERSSWKKFTSLESSGDGIVIDITGLDDSTARYSLLAHHAFQMAREIAATAQRF